MTLTEFAKELTKLGLPVAYDHFVTAQKPPFIVYINPSDNTFIADGIVYTKSKNVNLEVYTSKKDLALEKKLESFFYGLEIPYEVDEVWIESESVYLRTYYFEI